MASVPVLPYLTIVAEHESQRSLLRLNGELDAFSREELYRVICTVLAQDDPPSLVMDLSALSFADCAGLSVMVWAHQRLTERGRTLVLMDVQPPVRRLLRLTALDTYLSLGLSGLIGAGSWRMGRRCWSRCPGSRAGCWPGRRRFAGSDRNLSGPRCGSWPQEPNLVPGSWPAVDTAGRPGR